MKKSLLSVGELGGARREKKKELGIKEVRGFTPSVMAGRAGTASAKKGERMGAQTPKELVMYFM